MKEEEGGYGGWGPGADQEQEGVGADTKINEHDVDRGAGL